MWALLFVSLQEDMWAITKRHECNVVTHSEVCYGVMSSLEVK